MSASGQQGRQGFSAFVLFLETHTPQIYSNVFNYTVLFQTLHGFRMSTTKQQQNVPVA